MKCWGLGLEGRLGYGNVDNVGHSSSSTPLSVGFVATGYTRSKIFVGGTHTCAVSAAGEMKCWGAGSDGQLGLGDGDPRGHQPGTVPSTTASLAFTRGVVDVAMGGAFTCARLVQDAITCWGQNGDGQLGRGDTAPRGATPETIPPALSPIALFE